MKNFRTLLLASIILLFTAFAAEAGTRATMEVEVIEGGKIEKSTEITTFDEIGRDSGLICLGPARKRLSKVLTS